MSGKKAVIACAVMKHEFEKVIGDRPIDLHILEQGLHNTPKLMPGHISEKVAEVAASGPEEIILGYGLCSNGVVGVGGGAKPLVIPRCHDCISMLLGSVERYNEVFRRNPGTIYLSAGWVDACDDPLGYLENKYIPRMGEKKALRAVSLELAHYTHFCYIDNGLGDRERLKERTRENCRMFQKEYKEIQGSLEYFERLIDSPADGPDIIRLSPGRQLDEDMFMGG
jgi:Protein of unknown function (DUF1638).